jgi:hypothetical protein
MVRGKSFYKNSFKQLRGVSRRGEWHSPYFAVMFEMAG